MTIQEAATVRRSRSDCRNDIADIYRPQRRRHSAFATRCRRRSSPRSAGCWTARRYSFASRTRTACRLGRGVGEFSLDRRGTPRAARQRGAGAADIRICRQRALGMFREADTGHVRAGLQSGEPGPFAQAIAGIDLAVWDLYARRRKIAAVEAARRQHAARSRSMPAASIRPVRGKWPKRQ